MSCQSPLGPAADVLSKQASQVFLVEHGHMSRSSRRTLPLKRSAVPFCQGLRNAVRLGRMPKPATEEATSAEKIASLSKIKNRWEGSSGKAWRSCWMTQDAVGFSVTWK